MIRRINVAALGLLLGLAATGCAQERDPIDRVQPNVLKKSFFLGNDIHDSADDPEFYTRAYVSGSSYDQPAFNYGTGSGVDRIRFEVTEDLLIARKAYQIGIGRDDKGLPDGDPNGTVVAAYRIESHFDIRQSYNPVTGEEMNVREENGSDRPWYEREYFRVDWSTNEVANPMYLDELFSKWFGDPKITPMRYYVTDPTSEDAPFMDEKDGFFEITNRYFVEPGNMYFSWGELPSCLVYGWLSGTNVNDCNMQAADIRLGFWKIKPDADFESFVNTRASVDIINNFAKHGDSSLMASWGAPLSEYDPAYGFTDDGYKILMQHINIWEKSHVDLACNDTADANNDGTADQCERYTGAKGSRCDTFITWRKREVDAVLAAEKKAGKSADELKQIEDALYSKGMGKCTIPYRDRVVKTVGWFLNPEMPDVYQDTLDGNGNPMNRGAVEDVVYSWDQMFTATVAMARAAECRKTGGGNREECYAQYFEPQKTMVSYGGWLIDTPLDKKPVFTVCHNPVRNYDIEDACGKPGYQARTGDMRKFMLIDWPSATNAPFGGVTSLHTDPMTGELIGDTSLTVHVESRASRILDSLLVAMGDMTLEEYMGGAASERYSKIMTGPFPAEPLSQDEIQKRIKAIDTFNLAASSKVPGTPLTDNIVEAAKAAIRAKVELRSDGELRSRQALRSDQLLAPLRGTSFESELTDPHFLKAAGLDPNSALSESVLDAASPLRNMDATKLHAVRSEMEKRFARAGACFSELQDASTVGTVINAPLANYFLQKFGHLSKAERIEEMRKELRIESFKGVMLHEMGHALGMAHQFASSWDAPNYMPQYWQLRTNEGTAAGSCQSKPRDINQPDNCMGPRYLDPHTADEQGYGQEPRPRIEYFANTSTMEYQSERFSETAGLGTWDYGMTQSVYGRVLETYDPKVLPRDGGDPIDQRRVATRMWSHLPDSDLVYDVVHADDPAQESTYNTMLFGPDPFLHSWHYTKLARSINIFDPNRDCRDATEEEKAIAKWRIVHGKICQPYPRDFAAWDEFVSDNNPEVEEAMTKWHTRSESAGCLGGQICDPGSQDAAPSGTCTGQPMAWGTSDPVNKPDECAPGSFGDGVACDCNCGGFDPDCRNPELPVVGCDPGAVCGGNGTCSAGGWSCNVRRNSDMVRWSYRIGESYEPSYLHTNMLDSGADAYEAATNEIRTFNVNYPVTYFRRHRRGSPPSWYAANYAVDFFERLRSYHWSIANDNIRYLSFGKDVYDLLAADDNWSRSGVMANAEVFNALASYVLSPQPGDYRVRENDPSGVFDAINGMDPNADFVIQTIDGRFVDDAYDYGPDAGGSWEFQNYETRAGFYAEKAYAFLALCDSRPTLSTVARETYLDDRYVKINFRNDLPEAFDRLFGGLLAEDWNALGMWVDNTSQGQPAVPQMLDLMSVDTPPTRPAGAKVLFPNVGYTQQLYAAIFSALYARENTDMTLVHKMRIWIDGVEANISDVAFPDPEDQVRFYDPSSGFTYIARSFGNEEIDGRTVNTGIASRMLQRANQLVALSYVVEKDAQGNPVLDEYGRPVLILDAQGQAQPLGTFESKQGELSRYVGLVDGVRQLGHILGQGPY